MVYVENFDTRAEAAKKEKEIKGWRREKKKDLINRFTDVKHRNAGIAQR